MKRTSLRPARMGSKAKGSRYATSAQKRAILKAQQWLCAYCQEPLDYEGAAIDHVLAWAKGGRTEEGNLVACHRDENRQKGNRALKEYLGSGPGSCTQSFGLMGAAPSLSDPPAVVEYSTQRAVGRRSGP